MNNPINFELAKLLKEKGFDEPCRFVHDNFDNIEDWTDTDGTMHKNSDRNASVYYSAPTIAEVVMWCFNKYKYSIEYSMNIPESGEYDGCYVFNGLIKGSEDYKLKIFYTSKDYPTIEKALEDAINHFLVNFC